MKDASTPAFTDQTRQALLAIAIIAIAVVGVTLPALAKRTANQSVLPANDTVLKIMAQGL